MIIVTRQRNRMWNDRMAYTTTAESSIAFTEQMENLETSEVVDGRTITIDSYTDFARLIGVSDGHPLDAVINDKAASGLLNVDYLHRFAERHSLTYSIAGDRMFAAYRKYREQERCDKLDKESYYKEMWREGHRLLYGIYGGFGMDCENGLKLLHEAMENGNISALHDLLRYYTRNEQWGKAARYALDGAKRDDVVSMQYLSRLYEVGTDFENFTDHLGEPDYANAVEWCLKVAELGYKRSINRLNRFIHQGHLDPDSKRYVRLIKTSAQKHEEILQYLKTHPFVHPQTKHARLEIDETDEKKAIESYIRVAEKIPFPVKAIQILVGYIKDGKLDFDRLPETVKEKINHYNHRQAEKASSRTKRKRDFLYGDE